MRIRGAYEMSDMMLQTAKYQTGNVKDIQTLYAARTLKGATEYTQIQNLIRNKLLPEQAMLSEKQINNIVKGYYNLAPKGILDRDSVTIKALMKAPLDSLEFAENTQGVFSTSYFSNRAINDETWGLTRFELMRQDNPHLVEPYKNIYLKVNKLFQEDIKNFADNIIEKVNEQSKEKLIDENGDYTEFGEYVIELLAPSIVRYAFFKALTGENLKTKILPNGEITYDYKDIKNKTSLKSLGIHASNPYDEAAQLESLLEDGIKDLDNADVNYVASSILSQIKDCKVTDFRLAEAIVDKAGLGLAWRLDAIKDLMDQDAVRNKDTAFGDSWSKLIVLLNKLVQTIKSENPNAYIVAELTDVENLMGDTAGERVDVYSGLYGSHNKFSSKQDAMLKFFNETGITTEAAYSYFFTELHQIFGPNFENGRTNDNVQYRCNAITDKIRELINTRSIDYTRNLYTFAGNHDKPRIIHGYALDMKLFHGKFDIFNKDGYVNYDENRYNREQALIQLTNSDSFADMPLEAKLNIDNPEYFNTVSSYAVATAQLIRSAINDALVNKVDETEVAYLKSALTDLVNGNYHDTGTNMKIPSINIPELSSLREALIYILNDANIYLNDQEFNAVLNRANDPELIKQFRVQGDFDWDGKNSFIGKRNQSMADAILRGGQEEKPSGEWDYKKYSTYTMAIAGLLRQAFIDVRGFDSNQRYSFLQSAKKFFKVYDRAAVKKAQTPLPYYEDSATAMIKNGFAANDFKTTIELLIDQAEYKARKDGKLGENEHFPDAEQITLDVWRNATEPAIQKTIMTMAFLSALVGIPTLYGGDELGMSGYDEKAKNLYTKNRGPLPWSELEEGIFKDFRTQIQKSINEAMSIRTRYGVDSLNHGAVYQMSTSDNSIPAFMTQDGYGNMTISVFNATGINVGPRVDYFNMYGINESNKEQIFRDNDIVSINNDNRYVPIQMKKEIDCIELGPGISLPIDLEFVNSDLRDEATYIVKKLGERLAIVNKNGFKIALNGVTAKNGVMVLKHVKHATQRIAFKGSHTGFNKQYNIVSNPYQKSESKIEGQKLSVIAK